MKYDPATKKILVLTDNSQNCETYSIKVTAKVDNILNIVTGISNFDILI
jgi:hypothetical protein